MPVFSWTLAPPISVIQPTGTSGSTAATTPTIEKRGLLLPFRRDQKNDFAMGSGWAHLRSQLRMVALTPYGSVPYAPTYGSKLHWLKHRSQTLALDELARYYLQEALLLWVPRLQITRVVATRSDNSLELEVWLNILSKPHGAILVKDLFEALRVDLASAA